LTSDKSVIPSNGFFSIIKSIVMSSKKQFECHCHYILYRLQIDERKKSLTNSNRWGVKMTTGKISEQFWKFTA